ncbi:ethanolamine utilization protein EutJ [Heyndrickxia shackletonii]|uniref:Ethanolamine utilization protein EutJ n=1 Tax=Heyndrickxia shackletonii TaxID=157838 RepID=A0A0Q3TLD1_9BACI|nr:ABC transporter substrate-binding protein [Heyndrickxia shackletonii]KQL54473.1 ethanolamine utilization protein EutJ [Heyndrickxia shackletonii]MBB2479702.1 ABC transporter substrate-binding protein [Bacillus sp. APMAM]NEY99199.1 ABC transporter substrate-binding protein [Heyndrickxia shackletonii]RTZ56920.1 ABC transporter substrate-binding protein [Bacillus sp. SAJ1]
MKNKKFVGIMMSLLLSTGVIAGCGSASTGGSGKDSKTIVIGENLELSGGVASYGSSADKGIALALEEINKKGIDGKKLKIVKVDNKSDQQEATSAALKLITQNKVSAIIGAATSGDTLAQVQIVDKKKVPLITTSGTASNITYDKGKLNEFVFRTCFIDPFQGVVSANFASNNLNAKNAAIFIDSSSDYAKGLASNFKDTFTKNGGKIAKEEAYLAKDTDFRAQLTNIKAKNPDVIFVPGYYEEVGLIVKQARDLGINVPIMGGDGWDSPKLVELAGAKALNNTFITNHYSSGNTEDQKVQDFVKAFKDKYGQEPDGFNALGYDSLYLIADAIKRAGSGDPVKIKKALEETKDLQLVTGTFTFDDKHNPVKSAVILEYVDGKQQFKAKVNP